MISSTSILILLTFYWLRKFIDSLLLISTWKVYWHLLTFQVLIQADFHRSDYFWAQENCCPKILKTRHFIKKNAGVAEFVVISKYIKATTNCFHSNNKMNNHQPREVLLSLHPRKYYSDKNITSLCPSGPQLIFTITSWLWPSLEW